MTHVLSVPFVNASHLQRDRTECTERTSSFAVSGLVFCTLHAPIKKESEHGRFESNVFDDLPTIAALRWELDRTAVAAAEAASAKPDRTVEHSFDQVERQTRSFR